MIETHSKNFVFLGILNYYGVNVVWRFVWYSAGIFSGKLRDRSHLTSFLWNTLTIVVIVRESVNQILFMHQTESGSKYHVCFANITNLLNSSKPKCTYQLQCNSTKYDLININRFAIDSINTRLYTEPRFQLMLIVCFVLGMHGYALCIPGMWLFSLSLNNRQTWAFQIVSNSGHISFNDLFHLLSAFKAIIN